MDRTERRGNKDVKKGGRGGGKLGQAGCLNKEGAGTPFELCRWIYVKHRGTFEIALITDLIGQATCKTFLNGNTLASRKLGICQ